MCPCQPLYSIIDVGDSLVHNKLWFLCGSAWPHTYTGSAKRLSLPSFALRFMKYLYSTYMHCFYIHIGVIFHHFIYLNEAALLECRMKSKYLKMGIMWAKDTQCSITGRSYQFQYSWQNNNDPNNSPNKEWYKSVLHPSLPGNKQLFISLNKACVEAKSSTL